MASGRGKLLLTGDQDDAGIAIIVLRAERELSQPRPLSPMMPRLVEGRWTNFEPAAHAAKLHSLRLVAEAQAYAYQKQFLDERSARRGEDIFVATYLLGQGPDGVLSRSACAWSKGSAAPRAARREDVGAAVGAPSNAAPARAPLIDPDTKASNPGGMTLSLVKLRALQPQLFSDARPQEAGNRGQWLQLLAE